MIRHVKQLKIAQIMLKNYTVVQYAEMSVKKILRAEAIITLLGDLIYGMLSNLRVKRMKDGLDYVSGL